MKAIVDDKIPYIRGLIEELVDEVVYLPGRKIESKDVADADILVVRTRTRCDESLLKGSKVRLIVTATIGYDHIDTDYCQAAGIEWSNCPGCNAGSVCRYVMNSLALTNRLNSDTVIGIVGVGHVGRLVAKAAKEQGMKLLPCDPPRQEAGDEGECDEPFVELRQIMEEADVITFHTPLTHTGHYPTYHLADSNFFRSLKRRPLIINASRGAVVDNEALAQALNLSLIDNVVIDTWEGEPDNINRELLQKAIIVTPHIAGYSANGKANATQMVLNTVSDFVGKRLSQRVVLPEAELLTPETLKSDSDKFRQCPDDFESLRENYPVRKEF